MKKLSFVLAVLLCMVFALPAQAAYTPGETISAIYDEAYDAGKMLTGTMKLKLELDPQALGMDEQSAAMSALLLPLLEKITLSGAFGNTGDGLRLELGAQYADEAGAVDIDGAIMITRDGLRAESDVIEGEVITVKWESLLALLGLPQSDINMIMSVRDADIEAILTELADQLPALMQSAAQLLAPYGETCVQWASALPMETETNLPAQAGHPAAAQLVRITLTGTDIAKLWTTLANQLEKDETLAPVLDEALAQACEAAGEPTITTKDLCAAIRSAAADLNGSTPLVVEVAFDAESTPLYVSFYDLTSDGSGFYIALDVYEAEEFENTYCVTFIAAVYGADSALTDGMSIGAYVTTYPEDENAIDLQAAIQLVAEGASIGNMQYNMTIAPATTEEGQPAYETVVAMEMNIDDGTEQVRALSNINQAQGLTAAGGEFMYSTNKQDMYEGGQLLTSTVSEQTLAVNPGPDGAYSIKQDMGSLGVKFEIGGDLGAHDYVPTQLTERALETQTSEDMNALLSRAMTALNSKLNQLMQLLPPEVVQAMQ